MYNTMSIEGGIDMYAPLVTRYKSNNSPEGRKVKFLNTGGYEIETRTANKYFKEGQILTVKEIYVGRSGSEVEFQELPYKKFNTVMFQDVE